MPSAQPLPTITQLLTAAGNALRGERDRYADRRSGSLYNHVSGSMAVLLSRESDADADTFSAIYWDDAQGDDLSALIAGRTVSAAFPNGIQRILDSFGQGTATIQRSSAAAGGGSILQGTRIQVAGDIVRDYEVAQDTPVGATATSATVPIQALKIGSGTGINSTLGLTFKDAVYDPLWLPVGITCAPGTDYEDAASYRARARSLLALQRNGYEPRLRQIAQASGAAFVVLIPSSYGLAATDFVDDGGVNAVYVGDANYSASAQLINTVTVALESCRVLGADLFVGGMTRTAVAINAILNLVDDPGRLDVVPITRAATQALLGAFAASGAGFSYKRAALQGALSHAHPAILHAAIPYAWAAHTSYVAGDTVFPTPANGFIYQVTTGGSSGTKQPNFSTRLGDTTPDGAIGWATTSYPPQAGIYQAGVRQPTDPVISGATFPPLLPRFVLSPRDLVINYAGPI